MNYYKRHIGDYMKDASHLSLLEHGVYMRLLDVYYIRETGIPEDQAARLIGARSREERAALVTVLDEFFELRGDTYKQDRCDREIQEYNAKAERNREVGKKGGRPAKNRNQNGYELKPTENPDGFQNETETVVDNSENGSSENSENEKKNFQGVDDDLKNEGKNPYESTKPITQTVSKNNPSHKPLLKQSSIRSSKQDSEVEDATKKNFDPEEKNPGKIAAELIRRGVKVTSMHPTLLAWHSDGFTLTRILEAVAIARMHKPEPETIPANYLDRILREPPKEPPPRSNAVAAWWTSEPATLAKGSELGMTPRPGEAMSEFRGRINVEIDRRNRGAA